MDRYEAYKDSGVEWIGEIPETWECSALSFVSSCSNGATPSRSQSEYWNGEIPWMASGEVHQGYVTKTAETITQAGLDNASTRILPKNSVVIALNGQGATKGLSAILGIEACTNQSLAGFICDKSKLDYRWLNYCFVSMYGYLRGESGEAQRNGIAASSLTHEKIPLPSIARQQAIADFLDAKTAEIDGLVADCEREVELLQEYRKAVISEAVTKGLDPNAPMKDSGIEWIGEIPEGWGVARIKHVASTFGRIGFRGYRSEDLVSEGEGAMTLSPSNMENGELLLDKVSYLSWEKYDESPEIQIEAGDILFTKTGSSYGKTAYVASLPMEATINPQLLAIKDILCNPKFLYYQTCAEWFLLQVAQSVVGGTIPTIAQSKIDNFAICNPPIDKQCEIVAYLDAKTAEIDSLIDAKRQMIEKLREYRKSLISEAVTGKFKVPGV